ncbi:MAG: glycosyltransferase [archaeon]
MISVVIPAFNAEKTIKECLESLLGQKVKEGFEVIVVDDGSTDKTAEIVRKFKKVKLVSQKNSGPASARNNGARKAKGEVVFFTDSDCFASQGLLQKIFNWFKDEKVSVLAGSYFTKRKKSFMAKLIELEIRQRHEKIGKFIDSTGTYCFAIKKKVFFELGGFNESFKKAAGEDTEFCFKLKSKGFKIYFDKSLTVEHEHNAGLTDYLKDQFKRGYWRVNVWRKFKQKSSLGGNYLGKSFLPVIVLYGIFWLSVIVNLFYGFWIISLVLFILSLIVHLPQAFYAVKKTKNIGFIVVVFIAFLRVSVWLLGALKGLSLLIKK